MCLLSESVKDAASKAVKGMFTWYEGDQPGQIPGAFPTKWWEGSALFMAALQYWKYTGDTTYNDRTSQGMVHQGGKNGDYMPDNYSSYLVSRFPPTGGWLISMRAFMVADTRAYLG